MSMQDLMTRLQSIVPAGSILHRILPGAEVKERRAHQRISSYALYLKIDGNRYETLDWSLGGFRIANFHRPLGPREQITGKVLSRTRISGGEFTAEVVRKTVTGEIGFRFIDISGPTWMSMAGARAP